LLFGVTALDADEDHQAGLDGTDDLGFYAYFSVANALQQANHGRGG